MTRTCVIAEAASAHDRDFAKAKRLIDAASEAGVDAVKFQYWSSAKRLAERRHAADYLPIYAKYKIPAEWLPRLKACADARGLEFLCTVYLPEDVATVAPFVTRFKISSFESLDAGFLKAHEAYGKPVIVSTGMAGLDERFTRLDVRRIAGQTYVLHCVSAYPAPLEDLNLGVFRGPGPVDGFSDHSGCIETGGIAVAAGAQIIEVHLKLEDTDPSNPDAGEFALTPPALADYVAFIRQVEIMLGDGVKRRMKSEEPMARYRVTA